MHCHDELAAPSLKLGTTGPQEVNISEHPATSSVNRDRGMRKVVGIFAIVSISRRAAFGLRVDVRCFTRKETCSMSGRLILYIILLLIFQLPLLKLVKISI
jgi:hypothetical protein